MKYKPLSITGARTANQRALNSLIKLLFPFLLAMKTIYLIWKPLPRNDTFKLNGRMYGLPNSWPLETYHLPTSNIPMKALIKKRSSLKNLRLSFQYSLNITYIFIVQTSAIIQMSVTESVMNNPNCTIQNTPFHRKLPKRTQKIRIKENIKTKWPPWSYGHWPRRLSYTLPTCLKTCYSFKQEIMLWKVQLHRHGWNENRYA